MNITKERVKGNAIFWISLLLLWVRSMTATYLQGRGSRAVKQPFSARAPIPEVRVVSVPGPREVIFKEPPTVIEETTPAAEEAVAPVEILRVGYGDIQLSLKPLSPEAFDQCLCSGLAGNDKSWRDLFPYVLYQSSSRLTFLKFLERGAMADGRSAMDDALNQEFYRGFHLDRVITSWAETNQGACLAYLTDQGMMDQHLTSYRG